MKHTLKVTSGVMVDALISVFEKKGFIRIGQNVFKLTGYRPGPGVLKWDCEFDLEDYKEGEKADALIIFPADTSHVTVTPATWNGPEDGLPPVGLEVEAYFPKDTQPQWLKTTFLYVSDHVVVYTDIFDEIHKSRAEFDKLGVKLRLVRTAEQLAAEAHRAKYMPQLGKLWDADTERTEFLEAVYALIVEAGKS